ncbi:MAG: hypothetical protein GX847_05760, partial [Clostridiales bacterium]|nr:hypothetical protein [Clostridiales bacterium]
MENSNVKAKRPLRLIKNAAVIMLIFVFLIYFLPSDFTGSFFTDKDTDEAVFLVDPFNSACFCVLTDFCGGKWLIVTIPPQNGFNPNDLCWFTPNIVINGLHINENPVSPLYDYWQLFWQWTGCFNFTGNLLGILPLGTPDIDFNNASFRLNLNIDGVDYVFLDSLNGGYYSGIGIYGGFDSYSGAGGSPDFSQFYDFSGYNDFGEFFSSNYGAPGGPALTGRPDRQSMSLTTAGAGLIEQPSRDEP